MEITIPVTIELSTDSIQKLKTKAKSEVDYILANDIQNLFDSDIKNKIQEKLKEILSDGLDEYIDDIDIFEINENYDNMVDKMLLPIIKKELKHIIPKLQDEISKKIEESYKEYLHEILPTC